MNPVYLRLIAYAASTLLGSIPAVALGWFEYSMMDGVVTMKIQVEGAVTTLLGSGAVVAAIFSKWGRK